MRSSGLFWYLLLFLSIITSCNKIKTPRIEINNLYKVDSTISIGSWHIIGPFNSADSESAKKNVSYIFRKTDIDQFEFISKLLKKQVSPSQIKLLSIANQKIKDTVVEQSNDYINVGEVLGLKIFFSCYLNTTIQSSIQQDVALLAGVDNGIKIWVNGKLCISAHAKNITKDEFFTPIHLVKGDNSVVAKFVNDKDKFSVAQFTQTVAPITASKTLNLATVKTNAAPPDTTTLSKQLFQYFYLVYDHAGNEIKRIERFSGTPQTEYVFHSGAAYNDEQIAGLRNTNTDDPYNVITDSLAAGTYTVVFAGTDDANEIGIDERFTDFDATVEEYDLLPQAIIYAGKV